MPNNRAATDIEVDTGLPVTIRSMEGSGVIRLEHEFVERAVNMPEAQGSEEAE